MIAGFAAVGHYAIYYAALIRGYEASAVAAWRNLALIVALAFVPPVLARVFKYRSSYTVFTVAVLLFSIGLTVQYRLFSDPEYTSRRDKAEARQQKIRTQQLHYIQENYSAEKKSIMGLPRLRPRRSICLLKRRVRHRSDLPTFYFRETLSIRCWHWSLWSDASCWLGAITYRRCCDPTDFR